MSNTHIVIAPDSFKGSLSAYDVARAIAQGLCEQDDTLKTTLAPMADGGEGLLDAIAATCAGEWHNVTQTGIHGGSLDARWYAMEDGTAVIESAEVLGLPLVHAHADAPALADRGSYALGTLIGEVLDSGAREIAIGLGGSACNDAGLGCLMALGATGFDAEGAPVAPTMAGLLALDRLDLTALDARLADTRLRVLCDVDNPLLGDTGASRVYGPQKGLDDEQIAAVEAAFDTLAAQTGRAERAEAPGSGAAGGLGFALAVIGGSLESGADAVIELTGLAEAMQQADLVLTGEGRSDRQTLSGKLPLAIARAARPTPTVLIAGAIEDAARRELAEYFSRLYSLSEQAGSNEAALGEPERWLVAIAREIAADHR